MEQNKTTWAVGVCKQKQVNEKKTKSEMFVELLSI